MRIAIQRVRSSLSSAIFKVIVSGTVEMPSGTVKPKPSRGGGGGAAPPKKVSVQDMIEKIRELFEISDEEALYIKEVSQEKIEDESILRTIAGEGLHVGHF